MQRLLPPHLFVLCSATAVLLGWFVPILGPLTLTARALGIPMLALGLLLAATGSSTFATAETNINTFDDPDVLVSSGVFALTRNPMYLGFSLALFGVTTLVGALSAFAGPVAFILCAQFWYIPFEERRMHKRFGSAYEAYRQAVPRWVGRARAMASSTP